MKQCGGNTDIVKDERCDVSNTVSNRLPSLLPVPEWHLVVADPDVRTQCGPADPVDRCFPRSTSTLSSDHPSTWAYCTRSA